VGEKKRKYTKDRAGGRKVSEPLPGTVAPDDIRRATLFMNGRSQAVRLPKEFRFEGTHVFARKEGDRVILTPADDRWERFLAAFGSIPDFPDRDEGEPQKRPELDSWADASS
jgi:antitoxin VapB